MSTPSSEMDVETGSSKSSPAVDAAAPSEPVSNDSVPQPQMHEISLDAPEIALDEQGKENEPSASTVPADGDAATTRSLDAQGESPPSAANENKPEMAENTDTSPPPPPPAVEAVTPPPPPPPQVETETSASPSKQLVEKDISSIPPESPTKDSISSSSSHLGAAATAAPSQPQAQATKVSTSTPRSEAPRTPDNLRMQYASLRDTILQLPPDRSLPNDILTPALNLLVGGKFNHETNFVAVDASNVAEYVDFVFSLPPFFQADFWAAWANAVRKSAINAQLCCSIQLTTRIFAAIPSIESEQVTLADHLIDLLVTLASSTISVNELRHLFSLLQAENGSWPRHSLRLLHALRQIQQLRNGSDSFFLFNGRQNSWIQLPPLSRWPQQSWTFQCWLSLDPHPSGADPTRRTPYLFSFKTSKGVGYSGHFVGNNLVISAVKVKGKPMQHCVKFEFLPSKWHQVTIVFVYGRWSKSEIQAYVDGQLTSAAEMTWLVSPTEPFDRCVLGANSEFENDSIFAGRIASVYCYTEALQSQQIFASFTLGPNYQSQFRYAGETASWSSLSVIHYQLAGPGGRPLDAQTTAAFEATVDQARRALFDGHLTSAILFLYTPLAIDHQLCLNQAAKLAAPAAQPYFAHSSHALMLPGVSAIETQSLLCSLHSLGGVQMLYSLFMQLHTAEHPPTSHFCTILLSTLADFIERSPLIMQQVFQSRALQVIAYHLEKVPSACLSHSVLDCITRMTRSISLQGEMGLLRHLFDYILFNPSLWIRAPADVQVRLYAFLAGDQISHSLIFNSVRRQQAVLQAMHVLKYFYYATPSTSPSTSFAQHTPQSSAANAPRSRSASDAPQAPPLATAIPKDAVRPSTVQVLQIRSWILAHLRQMVNVAERVAPEEINTVLNYLTTTHEEGNLVDVMQWAMIAMYEHPASMIPGFDTQFGIHSLFLLLASPSERVRVLSLKILGFFLMRSTQKRKLDALGQLNLHNLIGERLLLHAEYISVPVYNVLFELLTEQMDLQIVTEKHSEPEATFTIENPLFLKPLATAIAISRITPESLAVRQLFLRDIGYLCQNNKNNRRLILQQSVWQDWLFALAFLSPQAMVSASQETLASKNLINAAVFSLFRTLLYHAIHFEYGGWRVWIDTLAILHGKLCLEETRIYTEPRFISSGGLQRRPDTGGSMRYSGESPASGLSRSLSVANPPGRDVRNGEDPAAPTEPSSIPPIQEGPEQAGEPSPKQETDQATADPNQTQPRSNAMLDRKTSAPPAQPLRPAPTAALTRRAFRLTEFKWSTYHQRLLSDLLHTIEADIQLWRSHPTKTVIEMLNVPDNSVYIQNTIHLISQLCDGFISSCGGLLPLLAASTSPKGELDVLEIGQGLPIDMASHYLQRLAAISDIFLFGSTASLMELENEKNMARGGIVRQALRIVFLSGIRNTLECRYRLYLNYQPMSGLILPGASSPITLGPPMARHHSLTGPGHEQQEREQQAGLSSLTVELTSSHSSEGAKSSSDTLSDGAVSPTAPVSTSSESAFDRSTSSATPTDRARNFSGSGGTLLSAGRNRSSAINDPIDAFISGAYLTNLSIYDIEGSMSQRAAEQLYQQQQQAAQQQLSVREPDLLLQELDINRLRAVVYREIDDSKQAQFLALASVYFLSVLIVSRYRDILEPPHLRALISMRGSLSPNPSITSLSSPSPTPRPPPLMAGAAASPADSQPAALSPNDSGTAATLKASKELSSANFERAASKVESLPQKGPAVVAPVENGRAEKEASVSSGASTPAQTAVGAAGDYTDIGEAGPQEEVEENSGASRSERESSAELERDRAKRSENLGPISTISSLNPAISSTGDQNSAASSQQAPPINTDALVTNIVPDSTASSSMLAGTKETLSARLERALSTAIPLLREIFMDFSGFLSKTLIGSHGQDLVGSGLLTMRANEKTPGPIEKKVAVEMAMLLCSQEWQTSLQRHAGLAFIELVNEGRLLAHATRDHIVRVANEAEFILTRLRADDVQKHARFDSICVNKAAEREEEEKSLAHLITSAKHRDNYLARKLTEKMLTILSAGDTMQLEQDCHTMPANCPGLALGASPSLPRESPKREYWLLDSWEDDSRRRRRFVPNPYGTSHLDAAYEGGVGPKDTDASSKLAQQVAIPPAAISGVTLSALGTIGGASAQPSRGVVTDEELEKAAAANLSEKEIADQIDALSHLANAGPVVYTTPCKLISLGFAIRGQLVVTKNELYFEIADGDSENSKLEPNVMKYVEHVHARWLLSEIRAIFSRTYLLQSIALEIFLSNRTAVFFAFSDQNAVRSVVNALPRVGIGVKYGVRQMRKASLALPRQLYRMSDMTAKWQRREVSNFDYLMFLNTLAGRSYNDLNQYPVFPWVITNYDGTQLDLNDPANFRDLSLPIGALNPERRAFFDERYHSWDTPNIPPFHYGTHMSTAAYTLNFLSRIEPFTSTFLSLQSGKFDHPNRMFSSISQTWKNCQHDTSDVKELIPEMYYMAEMFENTSALPLGVAEDPTGNGAPRPVGDVDLPPWAEGSPETFVRKMREALESDLVSCQLHHWVDLIFGYKQRGPEAVRSVNVYYYLTYEGAVNINEISDPITREAIENQIRNFGQMPAQLLTDPHPPRSSLMSLSPMIFTGRGAADDVCMLLKYPSNSPVVFLSANTHPSLPMPSVITVSANHIFAVNRWSNQNANIPLSNLGMSSQASQLPPNPARLSQQGKDAAKDGAAGASQPPTRQQLLQSLPLAMDQVIASSSGNLANSKRQLGDNFDERITFTHNYFVSTADNRNILAVGFWDNSIRAFSTDSGRLLQVVYGHAALVTCIARSECNINQDCYVVTGSRDTTLMVWLWNARLQAIVSDASNTPSQPSRVPALPTPQAATAPTAASPPSGAAGAVPAAQASAFDMRNLNAPRAVLYGHRSSVTTAACSAELGLVLSGSAGGVILMHTLNGDLVRALHWPLRMQLSPSPSSTGSGEGQVAISSSGGKAQQLPSNPGLIVLNREGIVLVKFDRDLFAVFGLSGRLLHAARHRDLVNCCTMSRDGQYIVIGTEAGRTELWRVHTLEPLHSFPLCDAPIRALSFTHDHKHVLAGVASGCVLVFNIELSRFNPEYLPALEQKRRESAHASLPPAPVPH